MFHQRETERMVDGKGTPTPAGGGALPRRELLSLTLPVCGMACFGLARVPSLSGPEREGEDQETHPFDLKRPQELSTRDRVRLQYGPFMELIGTLRRELGDEAAIRLLNEYSAARGRMVGEQQAGGSPDTSFRTFTATFRPPAYTGSLIHEVVEDTDTAFGLRVTECVWASVFREAGLDGALGHAAICNMDYSWPAAFNPSFRMERTRTLMQGDDHCDHRYIHAAE